MSAAPRPLGRADLEQVLDLWEALMRAGHEADPRWEPAPGGRLLLRAWALEAWTRAEPFPRAWVVGGGAGIDGFLAGMPVSSLPVLRERPAARITDLYVVPSRRRRGVGRALVQAFSRAAAEAGYPGLQASTLIRDGRAVAFWEAMGLESLHLVLTRG